MYLYEMIKIHNLATIQSTHCIIFNYLIAINPANSNGNNRYLDNLHLLISTPGLKIIRSNFTLERIKHWSARNYHKTTEHGDVSRKKRNFELITKFYFKRIKQKHFFFF